MSAANMGVLLTGLGLAANLVWTIINLRIEARLERRMNEMMERLDARFVSKDAWEERCGNCEEKYTELCRLYKARV